MKIKEKLQIILITYNRVNFLRKTLATLLSEKSPVKDFSITVLDNNSSDGTTLYIKDLQMRHPNINYTKNAYNLGISGNIAKAMEIASKEYYWIICDDDKYSWDAWEELEQALSRSEKLICVSRYALPEKCKQDYAYQLLQMTFVPSMVVRRDLLNDEIMRNAVDNIYTLFPHLCPALQLVNNKEKICVLSRPLVSNGWIEDREYDSSYSRGFKENLVYPRTKYMQWISGYANILSCLRDKKLKKRCFEAAVKRPEIGGGFTPIIDTILVNLHKNPLAAVHYYNLYVQFSLSQKIMLGAFKSLYSLRRYILDFYRTPHGINICLFGKLKTKIIPLKKRETTCEK